jgi:hypothetical protein
VLCFPIYSDMTDAEVGAIARAVERIHADRSEVRRALGARQISRGESPKERTR